MVGDLDAREPRRAGVEPGPQLDLPVLGAGVAGVDEQVDQHLLELVGIGRDVQGALLGLDADVQPLGAEAKVEQADRGPQGRDDVRGLDGDRLLAGEVEHLAQGARDVVALREDGLDLGPVGAFLQDLGAAADDGERGAELVGQASGQHPDRSQFLGAHELVLETVQLLGVAQPLAQRRLAVALPPEEDDDHAGREQEPGTDGEQPPQIRAALRLQLGQRRQQAERDGAVSRVERMPVDGHARGSGKPDEPVELGGDRAQVGGRARLEEIPQLRLAFPLGTRHAPAGRRGAASDPQGPGAVDEHIAGGGRPPVLEGLEQSARLHHRQHHPEGLVLYLDEERATGGPRQGAHQSWVGVVAGRQRRSDLFEPPADLGGLLGIEGDVDVVSGTREGDASAVVRRRGQRAHAIAQDPPAQGWGVLRILAGLEENLRDHACVRRELSQVVVEVGGHLGDREVGRLLVLFDLPLAPGHRARPERGQQHGAGDGEGHPVGRSGACALRVRRAVEGRHAVTLAQAAGSGVGIRVAEASRRRAGLGLAVCPNRPLRSARPRVEAARSSPNRRESSLCEPASTLLRVRPVPSPC